MEKEKKNNVLAMRVNDTVFEKVENLAKEQKVSKAKILDQAMHLYLNGHTKESAQKNYAHDVQQEEEIKSISDRVAEREITLNQVAAEAITVERPKYQEALPLIGAHTNVKPPMLQVMTANRRKIKGLAYDKNMEQYFYLIRPSKVNSPSRLNIHG